MSAVANPTQTSTKKMTNPFKCDDPFLLESDLSEEERMVHQTAAKFAQEKLMPRVLEMHRDETFDREIFYEMGKLGLFGTTIPTKYGGAALNNVCYGLVAGPVV